ncbi:MAG: relaxase domain-containing protein [Sporichthyaceae bacterium]
MHGPDSNSKSRTSTVNRRYSRVPAGLLKMWSKRTVQIETEASARIGEYENSLGRSLSPNERAAVTKIAVLKTRPAKSVHDAGTLQERWYAEAEAGGFDPGWLVHAVREAACEARVRANDTIRLLS